MHNALPLALHWEIVKALDKCIALRLSSTSAGCPKFDWPTLELRVTKHESGQTGSVRVSNTVSPRKQPDRPSSRVVEYHRICTMSVHPQECTAALANVLGKWRQTLNPDDSVPSR